MLSRPIIKTDPEQTGLKGSQLNRNVGGTAPFEPDCRCASCGLETLSIRVYDNPYTESVLG